MKQDTSLPALAPADPLGRRVFSRSNAKRLRRGKAVHNVFMPPKSSDNISVDRLDHLPDGDMCNIVRALDGRGELFCGWATVTVNDASQDRRTVRADPRLENQYHAEVDFNTPDDAEKRDRQKQHAAALATLATWRDAS